MKKHNTDTIDGIMVRLGKILSETNVELVKITEGGFPFTLEDVVLTASYDNVGIYVHSGLTPVCAFVRAGNPDTVVSIIKAKIRDVVESTKAAVERRSSLRDEAHALQAEGEKNEVTRLQVGKVANGTTSVDNRFSMFIAQLRKDMNDYVMEKRMNYWGRAEKKRSARQDLSQLSLAA